MEPPTRLRIAPKFGIDSAMNNRTSTEKVLKAHLFQLKSKKPKSEGCWWVLVQTRGNLEKLLEELGWRVSNDRVGRDEVEQKHDLHHHSLPTAGHGLHDVVLHLVSQGEVAASSHGEIYEEEN